MHPLRRPLHSAGHRRLLILSGDDGWQLEQLKSLWDPDERVLYLGETERSLTEIGTVPEIVDGKQLMHYLGQECDGILIDLNNGLSANTLGICGGMIRAGGLLILLTPPQALWKALPNQDNRRFLNTPFRADEIRGYFYPFLIGRFEELVLEGSIFWIHQEICQSLQTLELPLPTDSPLKPLVVQEKITPTAEQIEAMQAVHSVAFGHRKRPLLIHADRGRGKSALLGLAAIDCLLQGKSRIEITAARFDQVAASFHLAETQLQQSELSYEKSRFALNFQHQGQNKVLRFIAPDELLKTPSGADLLMVDEAAHLPTPLLSRLLQQHHRMVFATTLHGYEGSGRGFELRFAKILDRLTPHWKRFQLQQPLRWNVGDPLEATINHLLLLKTDLDSKIEFDSTAKIVRFDAPQLIERTDLLQSLFTLLVGAHYQTSPNDLQQLLDAPNLQILCALNHDDKVVGVCLAVEEGGLPTGQSHIHGHLIPRLLEKNYADQDFLQLKTWRIMRIAVHPDLQRLSIGKSLIERLTKDAESVGVDYLSSSFGVTPDLLPFWFNQGFRTAHLGVKRDKASATHALAVARALTVKAAQQLERIGTAFQRQLPHLLMEGVFHETDNQLLWSILADQNQQPELETDQYASVLQAYIGGNRPYEAISGILWQWSLQQAVGLLQQSRMDQLDVLMDKVLKKRSWQTVSQTHQLAGRRGVEETLKALLKQML
ncbi:tRNA(Met) cytidine acetyltransferase TmcA [Thiomicrorhabdus heinhorstiae]|uniref:tRNA(Met) cytidine acetyltransferase TmcA n=1 Tax=Thiomicrorhabdus heinhorstiae TaxID=2748010 RepID=A0ABS0BYT5_9GAMM|nr:GNAT family N-acetyltransferase [Thiomicrorhabdus heinhorstiae]MBF6058963.1 tRNA(Met) cytidine acetyltransferase [Thiomicrorhabdus heinhorstiae]